MKKNNAKINREEFRQKVEGWVTELWQQFNESAKGRKEVLETFDEMIFVAFPNRPNIVNYIKGIKESFLASESRQ
jgi:frataxin-like iron-binding protein CyaY